MLDAALMMMSPQVADAIERGQTDQRPGNRSPDLAGYATYYCQDDDIMVGAYTPRQHQRLLQALGIDQIIDLPERLTMQWVKAHKDALTELLEPRFTEQTAEYWEQRLNDFDVPAARVRDMYDFLANEQAYRARSSRYQRSTTHDITSPIAAFRYAKDGPDLQTTCAKQGADTDEVLSALGISKAKLEALRNEGIIL